MARIKPYLPLALIVGAMVVGSPRWIGLFANQEAIRLHQDVFVAITYLSGLGMTILEGLSIWYCWDAWASKAGDEMMRKVLMALIVAIFASIVFMVTPYIFAASQGMQVAEVLPTSALWVWSFFTAAAVPLIMAATGLAQSLGKEGPALVAVNAETKLAEIVKANPGQPHTVYAEATGKSRQWVTQKLKELQLA